MMPLIVVTGRVALAGVRWALVLQFLFLWSLVAGPATRCLLVTNTGRLQASSMVVRLVRRLLCNAAAARAQNLRDVQDLAGHADPRQIRRYDRRERNLDRHTGYALASDLSGGDR